MKHTPKIWYSLHPESGLISDEETGNTIARCYWAKDDDDYKANAALIAAAPELLEACRGLIDMITDNRTHGPEIDRACAAINKAIDSIK